MGLKVLRIALTALAVIITAAVMFFARECPLDFPQYYAAGKLFVGGRAPDIYKLDKLAVFEHEAFPKMPVHHEAFPEMPADPIPFWYPPFSVPYFAWLALFSPAASIWMWEILSLTALGASLWLMRKSFALSTNTIIWAAIAVALSGPCAHALVLGQLAFFLLLALSLAIYGLKTENPAAAIIGLTILAMKPNIALPIYIFLLGARRYKLLLQVMAAGVVLVAFSLLTEGVQTYQAYLDVLKYVAGSNRILGLDSCATLQAQILRLIPAESAIVSKFSYALWALVLGGLFWLGNRFRQSPKWLEVGLVAGLPLGLVTAPYLHPYDLLLLVPSFLMFTTMTFQLRLPKDRSVVWISLGALFFVLAYSPIYKAHLQFHVHVWALLAYSAIFIWTVLRNTAQLRKVGT
jgi:hypothetical protein